MTDPTSYWCETAYVDGQILVGVSVEIADGRFGEVTPETEPDRGARRLPGVTIPGMANAHSHAFHRALRSRTQVGRGSFWTWRDVMYGVAARLDPDTYYALARATFAEMALAGITAVGEFHYLHHGPDGTPYDDPNEMGHRLLSAATAAGLRISLLDTLYLHGGLSAGGHVEPSGPQTRYSDGDADSWAARVDAMSVETGQLVGAAIHSVRAVDRESMGVAAAWAESMNAPLHAHVSEQPAENEQCLEHHGVTPTALLEGVGALGERFTSVHATHLESGDVDALVGHADRPCTVCLCPTTERDLGDGIGPTRALASAGVPIALGSDSHAVIDMFEEARATELDERLRSLERGVHSANDLLDMATVNGHRSIGWSDAGRIAPGTRADLVTVALDSVRTAGATPATAAEATVFAASAADVRTVISDGRMIVDDGQHLLVPDVAGELDRAIAALFRV